MRPILNVAIILHMHQPRYNLAGGASNSETAKEVFEQTMHPYTVPPEVIRGSREARATFNFTGTLIEQMNELAAVDFDPRLDGIWEDYGSLEQEGRVELTGCGYFHPIFPLIPEADRRRQVEMHLEAFEETFGLRPAGFWPPELAFSEDMVPLLAEAGFQWTVVDEPHLVNANRDREWHELLLRPHYLERDGRRVAVVARDRDISIAQQSGYDPEWLKNKALLKIQGVPKNLGEDLLLVIATDGENGWFRHSGERAGFWGWFFRPLLESLRSDPSFDFINLTTVRGYLRDHPPEDVVRVESGSWNFEGWPSNGGFGKWTAGKARKKCWKEIERVSRFLADVGERVGEFGEGCPNDVGEGLEEARRWLLTAEASDHFYWGTDEWLNKARLCCAKAMEKGTETLRLCNSLTRP